MNWVSMATEVPPFGGESTVVDDGFVYQRIEQAVEHDVLTTNSSERVLEGPCCLRRNGAAPCQVSSSIQARLAVEHIDATQQQTDRG